MPPWFPATIAPMAFAGLTAHPYAWVCWWAAIAAACWAYADSDTALSEGEEGRW